VREGDLYIAMEPWHAKSIEEKLGSKVHSTLLGLWGTPRSPYIHDPYGTMPSYFDHCFDQIEKSVSKITHEIYKAKAK